MRRVRTNAACRGAPPGVEDQQLRDQDDDRDQQPERSEGAVGPAHGQEAGDLEDVGPLPGAAHDDPGRRQLRRRVGRRLADPDLLGRSEGGVGEGVPVHHDQRGAVAEAGEERGVFDGLDEHPAALHAAQLLVVEWTADDDRRHGATDTVPRDGVEGRAEGVAGRVAAPRDGAGERGSVDTEEVDAVAARAQCAARSTIVDRSARPAGSGGSPSVDTTRSAPRKVAALSSSVRSALDVSALATTYVPDASAMATTSVTVTAGSSTTRRTPSSSDGRRRRPAKRARRRPKASGPASSSRGAATARSGKAWASRSPP